jgi:serine/threonine protein kinase
MSKDLRTYLDEKKEASRERQPPLSLFLAINIMLQIADGMKHLHESGVMHRDLKSNNVLVNVVDDQDGSPLSSSLVQVKLTDFGVSKLHPHDSGCSTRNVGTTKWRAPEVFEDEENRENYTKSADVYSFAIIFSEVLTGEMPFQGMPQTNLLQRIRNGERPPLPHVDYCPDYLSELINKCWATNPGERRLFPEICEMLVDCKERILMQSYLVSSRSSQCHRFFHACWLTLPVRDEIIYSGVNFFPSMKVMSGYGMRQGRSASMEDFLSARICMINSQAIGLFGVFHAQKIF